MIIFEFLLIFFFFLIYIISLRVNKNAGKSIRIWLDDKSETVFKIRIASDRSIGTLETKRRLYSHVARFIRQ